MSAFEVAVDLVLALEGEHSVDPADPGGETWFGISRRTFPDLPWPPSRDDAVALYRRLYWDATGCEELPAPLAVAVFDAAVNQGPRVAVVMLQRILGVALDGVIGPETRSAAARNVDERVARYLARRARRYVETANFARFGDGWLYRLFRVSAAAARTEG